MDFLAAGLSTVMNVFLLGLFVAGVLKLFQIHTVLTEMKDALGNRSVPRSAPPPDGTPLHSLGSGDEMLRAVDAQLREEELKSASPR